MIANTKTLLFSIALAGIFGSAAIPAYKTLENKASSQMIAVHQLARWKSEYESLRPFQQQWDQKLTSAAQVDDVYTILRIVGLEKYGFTVDTEKLVVTKIDALMAADGTPLNADRVCLATAGLQGIVVTADNIYPTLITGLDRIAKRKDIEIPSITLSANGNVATATFPLCLRLRR